MKQIPFHEFQGRTIEEVLKEWKDYLRRKDRGYSYDSDEEFT